MKYLNINDHHSEAECSNDAIKSSELLVSRLAELEEALKSLQGLARLKPLLDSGYTSPSKLAISGGSNGGLLVGAVMNQRPDLFGVVVCSYPLLDMLRYHKLLMGPFWVSEYGSPDDPDDFEYIYAYSPYHNVTPGGKYPAILFETGDSDTRVDPMHARKMTALLQAETGSDKPVMLYYDTKAGHSGGTPLSKQIDDMAVELGFVLDQLGVTFR